MPILHIKIDKSKQGSLPDQEKLSTVNFLNVSTKMPILIIKIDRSTQGNLPGLENSVL
jgi:hypothetical protein